jgi:hypothetical protein
MAEGAWIGAGEERDKDRIRLDYRVTADSHFKQGMTICRHCAAGSVVTPMLIVTAIPHRQQVVEPAVNPTRVQQLRCSITLHACQPFPPEGDVKLLAFTG